LSRDFREILRAEAAMPRTARSGGVSAILHRTTVRRADLIEGTDDSLAADSQRGNQEKWFTALKHPPWPGYGATRRAGREKVMSDA
jgi:hypothetical protein